jgi:DNA-binding transcriptional MerR regulator
MNDTTPNESPPDDTGPSEGGLFPIRTVARLTGINPITLRAWERRHNLIRPIRTPSGHRLYSTADIDLIRRIQSLSEQGMGFSQIGIVLKREARLTGRIGPKPPNTDNHAPTPESPPLPAPLSLTQNQATVESLDTAADAPPGLNTLRVQIRQAAIALNTGALVHIEQQALLWYPPEEMIRLFLIDGLHRLERREIWPDQNLVLHWLSDHIHQRIDGLLRQRAHLGQASVAVDIASTDRCYRAAEFELVLALAEGFNLHLIPPTLPVLLRSRLVARWGLPHWIRFQLAGFPANHDITVSTTTAIHPCQVTETPHPVEITPRGLCRGSVSDCQAYLSGRFRG